MIYENNGFQFRVVGHISGFAIREIQGDGYGDFMVPDLSHPRHSIAATDLWKIARPGVKSPMFFLSKEECVDWIERVLGKRPRRARIHQPAF